MKRSLQLLILAAVALAAASAAYFARHSGGHGPAVHEVSASSVDALLALRLPDTAGVDQALEQWRGKVIVANFWATWCPPCRKEMPDFAASSQAFADQPVQFVGISIDDADKVRAFGEELQIPYPLLIAGNEVLQLARGFGNDARALPFTVILDRAGKPRLIRLGSLTRSELDARIRELLAG